MIVSDVWSEIRFVKDRICLRQMERQRESMGNRKWNLNKAMIVTILSLAWPTMLEQLMNTAVQYIDTAMVGSLGTQATAAVGATSTVSWLIGSTVSAFGVGFFRLLQKPAVRATERLQSAQCLRQYSWYWCWGHFSRC